MSGSRAWRAAAVLLPLLLLAACEEDTQTCDYDPDNDQYLEMEFRGNTVCAVEKADSSSPVGYDPWVFAYLNTPEAQIEVVGARGIDDFADKVVAVQLPDTATVGTYTEADGAEVFFAKDYTEGGGGAASQAYVSSSVSINVKTAGAVGSRWSGTFESELVLIFGSGPESGTATGTFAATREADDF